MHILFFTDNFPPEVNAPASRTYEHSKMWVEMGHAVTIITCAPNFPKGKVYPGYKNRLIQKEFIGGIEIIRVWTFMAPNEGTIKRTADYLSFMFTSVIASMFVRKPDVIIGTSPQFFTVCAAYLSAKMKSVPWIFELRDLWPESIKVVGHIQNSVFLQLMERIELFLYRKANSIISVTNSFRNQLSKRGIDERKIYVVTNGVDLEKFSWREKDTKLLLKLKMEKKFIVGYIGTLGLAHGLETLLYAAKNLQNEMVNDVQFVFVGDGAAKAKLEALAVDLKLKNTLFFDSVSKDEVKRFWSILDYTIIHLRDEPLFQTVIPSKLFESMGMGVPILHGVKGESAKIIEESKAGKIFDPENIVSLTELIKEVRSNPSLVNSLRDKGIAHAKLYDRKELAVKMLNIIEKTVKDARLF